MILNNSGIVHCATRTRGREETAMNMQELLTYVEELTFKTSMFGYDKDEVDIQLDKICDEAEAIILAKEKEIEELKKERDRKSTRLNSSHPLSSRMPSSA